MAARSRAQFDKRQKELARQERQKEKRARRQAAREARASVGPDGIEGNPDAAGSPLETRPDEEAPDRT